MAEMSRNNARKMKFYGNTLEECVNALLKFQDRGESVYVEFNGHKLYSCDITMDGAYQEVCGKTKAEYDKAIEEWRENYKKQEEKDAPYSELKKSAVQVDFSWKYGNTLDAAVKELEEYKDRGESVYIEFNGHKLYSCDITMDGAYQEVCGKTKAEYDKAIEEWREKYKEQEEKDDPYSELKKSAVQVDFSWKYGNTLDAAVKELEEYKDRGESVVVDFNGHKLYSCDITMDGAYQEVCGKTKAEYDKAIEEWRENYKKQEEKDKAEAEAKIPEWIKKGEAFIYPERDKEWEKCVKDTVEDLSHGVVLDEALEIMERLESGATLDEAKELLDSKNYSGASYGMVRDIIFLFSKQGPEFWEHTAYGEISPEDKIMIADKKRENAELDELHRDQSTKIVSSERKTEEQEITDSSAEKEQLTSEISDIEQQLAVLRAKEAELKKSLNDKQSQLNELDEK